MGNSVSNNKERHGDEVVDFGHLSPQGVYTAPQDWNQEVVANLIIDRKLAPFYRPLEEYNDSWDEEQILAARKPLPESHPHAQAESTPSGSIGGGSRFHHKQSSKAGKEVFRPSEASIYRGAVECPICFLYYPSNINRSRCCDQSICTECFVQIKRAEPTTTHLVSEPASCPYCVQESFGVTYEPPPWRTGLIRDGRSHSPPPRPDMHKAASGSSTESEGTRRRKSFSADSPEVVTIDHIRPDWEAKLAAVRAAVARRANRRIIMRQVGDRLIPIGVTSGRVVAPEGAEGPEIGEGTGRRRRRHHQGGQDLNQLLGSVGIGPLGGPDLEELMVMEAMRLSLLEHEEQQRRQAAENNNNEANTTGVGTNGNAAPADARDFPSLPADSATPNPSPRPPVSSLPRIPRGNEAFQLSPSLELPPGPHPRLSPSPSLAAALSAAQTASAFLNAQSGMEEQHRSRGSRTPSPDPVASSGPFEPLATAGSAGSSVVDPPVSSVPGEPTESSAMATELTGLYTIPESVASPDSGSRPMTEDASVVNGPVSEGYLPLTSSMESSDPLLHWNEGETQQGQNEEGDGQRSEHPTGEQGGNLSVA